MNKSECYNCISYHKHHCKFDNKYVYPDDICGYYESEKYKVIEDLTPGDRFICNREGAEYIVVDIQWNDLSLINHYPKVITALNMESYKLSVFNYGTKVITKV